ncbi:hypothetical protein [Streptomyces apocyni]|uniref:hypothetical protein n=1 Tax=Streptomyces apocyni TaxID=2654677 RepID=UPI0012E9C94C|nr:hypothetical protein [Streptomyces apocyni]
MTELRESGGRPRLLLVESQGRTASDAAFRRDAVAQVLAGHSVTLLLIQDAAALSVPGSDTGLDRFQKEGGLLAADRFSLAQRGLDQAAFRDGLRVVDMDEVGGWVLDPDVRVVWH